MNWIIALCWIVGAFGYIFLGGCWVWALRKSGGTTGSGTPWMYRPQPSTALIWPLSFGFASIIALARGLVFAVIWIANGFK